MLDGYQDRTLSNPSENNLANTRLERFVALLGYELSPNLTVWEMLPEIARRLCQEFNLKPPILSDKIRTFLEEAGIHLEDDPYCDSTTFFYNRTMSRYEIRTRSCFQGEWSLEIGHELWEILFWRCFHKIDWWKDWAIRNKITKPHDKADEFAFHLLLSPGSVPAQAKKCGHDVYAVARYYRVPTNLAFRALSSYGRYKHPVVMALLKLNTSPPKSPQPFCMGDLFADISPSYELAHAEVYNKFYKSGKGAIEIASHDVQRYMTKVQSLSDLSSHLKRKSVLSFETFDPIYRRCQQPQPQEHTVTHILGLDLNTELTVITRQAPTRPNEIFVQIMPPQFKEAFLLPAPTAWELVTREDEKQFRQAARSI